jgi:DNA repair protein RecO
MEAKILGLLLHTTPYLGRKKILKIFTPDGLLTCITASPRIPTDPFCLAEWVYKKTQTEIYPLLDATLLDSLHHLRENFATLTAAGSIAQDLLKTQMPHKPAPEIFELATLYLKKLPLNPSTLAASFRLKLLYHEGLLSEEEPTFTPEEQAQVAILAFSRKLSLIASAASVPQEKIELLFKMRLF